MLPPLHVQELQPLFVSKPPAIISMRETDFFENLEKLCERVRADEQPTVLISSCQNDIDGFHYHEKLSVMEQYAQELGSMILFIIVTCNDLKIKPLHNIEFHYIKEFHSLLHDDYQSIILNHQNLTHKFISLNKRSVPWRQLLYRKFWQDGLLPHSYFSYLCEDSLKGTMYHEPSWQTNQTWLEQHYKGPWPEQKFYSLDNDQLLEKYINTNVGIINGPTKNAVAVDPTWNVDNNMYEHAFCSVVLETDVGNRQVNISEKTIRPLAIGHPLLVLGAVGTVQHLRDLGLDMLDDIFDFAYDQETDIFKRVEKFFHSIDQIASMSYDELTEIRTHIQPRLQHNRTQLNKLKQIVGQKGTDINNQCQQRIKEFFDGV